MWHSILAALQFFTVIPIRREIPLTKRTVTGMFLTLAWIGLGIGALQYGVFVVLSDFTLTPLFIAVALVLTSALLTGGLHLDGFIDTSDAFFSYRDIKKRHAILDDPRVGAFGVMAFVFLILSKIVILYELITLGVMHWALFVLVPFMTRSGMLLFVLTTKPAKDTGIAHFFLQKLHKSTPYFALMQLNAIIILFAFTLTSTVPVILAIILLVTVVLYRSFTLRNFGGMSGDLFGAYIEGAEVVLWLALLLHYA